MEYLEAPNSHFVERVRKSASQRSVVFANSSLPLAETPLISSEARIDKNCRQHRFSTVPRNHFGLICRGCDRKSRQWALQSWILLLLLTDSAHLPEALSIKTRGRYSRNGARRRGQFEPDHPRHNCPDIKRHPRLHILR